MADLTIYDIPDDLMAKIKKLANNNTIISSNHFFQ